MPEIDIYIVLAQIVNFGILFGAFYFFIGKKLSHKILERREQIEKLKKAEEHYEQKMSLAKQQKEEMLLSARKAQADLMKESKNIADEKAQAIISKANFQALSILEGGRRDVEKERLTMLSQMKEHIIDVSLKLNERMFGEKNMNKDYIEEEIKKI